VQWAANLRMLLLSIPIVVAPALVVDAVARLRLGPLDDLREPFTAAGADTEQADRILAALSDAGLRDIGSVRALFGFEAWRPRIMPVTRLKARDARRSMVKLVEADRELLIEALALYDGE
jgi:hypothetical protein